MFQADVYKIMIGAPSDIIEEVDIAINVINHWNYLNSEIQKVVCLPLHWSISSYPEVGRHPQKVINNQVVSKSDLLICVFGSKLGTPTDDYASGSVEEIEEHIKKGKPVMIFFKRVLDINNCDIEQLTRLRKFKESIGDKALYVDYNDATDFGKILTDKLILCINSIFIKDKVVINGLEWEEIGDNINLSDFDKERLKAWTSVDNPDFFQVHFEGGGCIYGLGAVNQYQVKNSKEKIEWDSFFEKLLSLELIKIKGYDKNNNPIYQLKIDAYKYVENNAL